MKNSEIIETAGNPKSRNYPKNTGVSTPISSSITFMLAGWRPWLRRTMRWSTRRPAYSPCSCPQPTPSGPTPYILSKNVLPSDWPSLHITFRLLLNQELVVDGNLFQLRILWYAFQHKISHNWVQHLVYICCIYYEMMVLTYCTWCLIHHIRKHARTHTHTLQFLSLSCNRLQELGTCTLSFGFLSFFCSV
jgi:hypothetical protein